MNGDHRAQTVRRRFPAAAPFAVVLAAAILACGGSHPQEPEDELELKLTELRLEPGGSTSFRTATTVEPLEPNDWHEVEPATWARVQGREGRLQLWAGRPGARSLTLEVARAPFLPFDVDFEVQVNGRPVGFSTATHEGRLVLFEVDAEFVLPGRNEVLLRASESGRPIDHIEGSGDTREFSLQLAAAGWARSRAPILAGAAPVDRVGVRDELDQAPPGQTRLAPGEFLATTLVPRDDAELVLVPAEPGGSLWVGLRDIAAQETLDWSQFDVVDAGRELRVDLGLLSDRPVEVVLSADNGGGPVALARVGLTSARPPASILLIVVDTLRADRFDGSALGEPLPAFERLRRDGASFPVTRSHAPMTLPSHVALFSSRYPHRSGVTNNWQAVPTELPLLAAWLQECGFDTSASVSLGTLWTPTPGGGLERGFDRYLSTPDMFRGPEASERVIRLLDDADPERSSFVFAHYCDPHEPYNTRRFGPRYCALEAGETRLSLALNQWTHTELEVTPGSDGSIRLSSPHQFKLRRLHAFRGEERVPLAFQVGAHGRRGREFVARVEGADPVRLEVWVHDVPEDEVEAAERYGEEVAYADRFVGGMLDALDARGLYEESLIVFTSDHGEQLMEHGHLGHARDLYDPELRVPLVIKPPASNAEALEKLRRAAKGSARHVDVVPTVLDLLDLPPLPGQMGRSLLEIDGPRLHLAETYRPESPRDLIAQTDGRYKLIHAPGEGSFELYDLEADEGETEDLWDSLSAEFADWAEALRLIAAGKTESLSGEELDQATRDRLEALGYL